MRVDGDVDMNTLPGADLVLEGIADAEYGRDTIAAALTRMASPRLRYNALVARMVSFARAAERAQSG
jgi:hypothetical protein